MEEEGGHAGDPRVQYHLEKEKQREIYSKKQCYITSVAIVKLATAVARASFELATSLVGRGESSQIPETSSFEGQAWKIASRYRALLNHRAILRIAQSP